MKVQFKVTKIKCEGCVEAIAKALLLVEGLSDLTVDSQTKIVSFEAADAGVADSAGRALKLAGYPGERIE